MTNYWSNTKFAGWIRGTKKINHGTAHDWVDWNKAAKEAHPFRFWLAEEGLDYIQRFLLWPWEQVLSVKYYINNRFVSQSHALVAHKDHIKRGQWRDVSDRILPCLFDTLVDFVEIETAHMQVVFEPGSYEKYKAPFWARGIFHIRTWRCPQAGLDNLTWASGLIYDESAGVQPNNKLYGKPTNQALGAKEILALYNWYTKVYLKRPDPMDLSGWTAICDQTREKSGSGGMSFFDHENETKAEKVTSNKALKLLTKIESQYKKEDTEMMIRLIKVRDNLWT